MSTKRTTAARGNIRNILSSLTKGGLGAQHKNIEALTTGQAITVKSSSRQTSFTCQAGNQLICPPNNQCYCANIQMLRDSIPPGANCYANPPAWWCPKFALRNAVVAAPAGALLGAFVANKRSRTVGMVIGAAFSSLASWYWFSGRWWQ